MKMSEIANHSIMDKSEELKVFHSLNNSFYHNVQIEEQLEYMLGVLQSKEGHHKLAYQSHHTLDYATAS